MVKYSADELHVLSILYLGIVAARGAMMGVGLGPLFMCCVSGWKDQLGVCKAKNRLLVLCSPD